MYNQCTKFSLHFCVYFISFYGALSTTNFSTVAEIGKSVNFTLNLTELGWHTHDMVRSVLAWKNMRHPITKLKKGSTHSVCYDNLSFLESVRCSDFNVSIIEANIVLIKMRLVSKAMATDYIYYPTYSTVKHDISIVQISVHLKAGTASTNLTVTSSKPDAVATTAPANVTVMQSSKPDPEATTAPANLTVTPSSKPDPEGDIVILSGILVVVVIAGLVFAWQCKKRLIQRRSTSRSSQNSNDVDESRL